MNSPLERRNPSLTQAFSLSAYDWDMKNEQFISSEAKDPDGLQLGDLVAHGDALFWTSENSYATGINSWTPADGARPFIRWVGDATRGARAFGTDGTTMVWSYGEGKKPSDGIGAFPIRSIMSAPFTTDPAKLQPKRLRSDPNPYMGGGEFRIACGRAANGGSDEPVVVVRLSDGVSWLVTTHTLDFDPWKVLGVTCDHVYLYGRFDGRYNITRLRLDSLGPGLPPD